MSGRYETETKFEDRTKQKLQGLPSVVTEYYYSLISAGSTFATISNYVNYISSFLKYTFGEDCKEDFYKEVKPMHINKYIASLRTKVVKGKVQRTSDSIKAVQWSALNSFFQFLVPDYMTYNPVSNTKRPKNKDNPNVTYLNSEEIAKIYDNIKNTAQKTMLNRDLCLLKLGFNTGLRISALVNIDIDDIDLKHGHITVTEKGDRDYRVLIGENLKQQIELWMEDREKYFGNCDTNALFVSQCKNRISTDAVRKLLTRYSEGATDKNVTPHVMRHSCATALYEKTGDIYLCAKQLHHQQVTTTQRYAEMSQKKQKEAVNILDSLF